MTLTLNEYILLLILNKYVLNYCLLYELFGVTKSKNIMFVSLSTGHFYLKLIALYFFTSVIIL